MRRSGAFADKQFLMSLPPFTLAEIQERLDNIFIELPPEPVAYLATLDIQTQDTFLTLIAKAASISNGLAYQFGQRIPRAHELMELDTIELWLHQAIDAIDSKGLHTAINKLDELEQIAHRAHEKIRVSRLMMSSACSNILSPASMVVV